MENDKINSMEGFCSEGDENEYFDLYKSYQGYTKIKREETPLHLALLSCYYLMIRLMLTLKGKKKYFSKMVVIKCWMNMIKHHSILLPKKKILKLLN